MGPGAMGPRQASSPQDENVKMCKSHGKGAATQKSSTPLALFPGAAGAWTYAERADKLCTSEPASYPRSGE